MDLKEKQSNIIDYQNSAQRSSKSRRNFEKFKWNKTSDENESNFGIGSVLSHLLINYCFKVRTWNFNTFQVCEGTNQTWKWSIIATNCMMLNHRIKSANNLRHFTNKIIISTLILKIMVHFSKVNFVPFNFEFSV